MAKARPETIILKGDPNLFEAPAAAEVKPGHVVEYNGDNFRKQSTAKKNTALRVVTEQDLIGKSIEDAIAAGVNVTAHFARPGDVVQVALPANAAAIVKGDQLELSGDGTVRKVTDGNVIGEAFEDLDNSATATETLIKVQSL